MAKADASLREISPDHIRKNPDNPRLIFREDEMNELLESIRTVGIKVPVAVFTDGNRFTLLDGERRWRCAKKLNLSSIPALVQPKPTRLENLLMMFNIHNVRVEWDPMPMALKLAEVRRLLEKEGEHTTPKELAAVTGVRPSTVRRALDLLDLPVKYQRLLLREAERPKHEQRFTADLFLEIYKSLHAVERNTPEVFDEITKRQYVDSMVRKYEAGIVDSVTAFRNVSRIARAESAGVNIEKARPAIVNLVRQKNYSISQAYADTVQAGYEQRDLLSKVQALTSRLSELTVRSLDEEVRSALGGLRRQVDRLLGAK